jgi:hypothetical protein
MDAYDAFIAVFDSDGTHLWSRRIGAEGNEYAVGVAFDNSGNLFVTGFSSFSTAVDFGGGPLTAGGLVDVYVAKYDAAGGHLWSKLIGDANYQQAYGLDVDDFGNAVITGLFEGSMDFGGGPLTSAGGVDVYLARYSGAGTHLFSTRYGSTLDQLGVAVGTDAGGNIYLTGMMRGTVDFGGGPLTSAGSDDIFVAAFDSVAVHLWSRRYGSTGQQTVNAIAVDASGRHAISGWFLNTVDFGGGVLTCAAPFTPDMFVADFAPDGSHGWSRRAGDSDFQEARSVAIDPATGDVIIAGSFLGATDFGGGTLTNADSGNDLFIAAYDATGNHLWSHQYPDTLEVTGVATVDGSGAVISAGRFSGTVDFGGGPLVSGAFGEDVYVARFLPGGATGTGRGPAVSRLGQNFPNPFNPSTTIEFALDSPSRVAIEIVDARGARVATLHAGARGAGTHQVAWDGRDDAGRPVASGVYFYRLQGAGNGEARKMVLLK